VRWSDLIFEDNPQLKCNCCGWKT